MFEQEYTNKATFRHTIEPQNTKDPEKKLIRNKEWQTDS